MPSLFIVVSCFWRIAQSHYTTASGCNASMKNARKAATCGAAWLQHSTSRSEHKASSVLKSCPWTSGTTALDWQLECQDGTLCYGWSCCTGHGGRARCPPNMPLMCNSQTCGDGDHCCKENCEDWGGVRACPSSSTSATCPWNSGTTLFENQLECVDGTLCYGWSCCTDHGGRARCPPNKPLMCSSQTCGDGDHCCKETCDDWGGVRPCSSSGSTGSTGPASAILMIGNSYTYYNGGVDKTLSFLFQASSGKARSVQALTKGGAQLPYHALEASSPGTPHHAALSTSSKSWEFVVLQDQSTRPARVQWQDGEFQASVQAVLELDKKIEERSATTVFYQTWGRRDDSTAASLGFGSFASMTDATAKGYAYYADKVTRDDRIPLIAPVGRAFQLIHDDSRSLHYRLYNSDGTHPSDLGTYLAACVMFSTMTGETSIGLPSHLGLSQDDAADMQLAANRAVFGTTSGPSPPSSTQPGNIAATTTSIAGVGTGVCYGALPAVAVEEGPGTGQISTLSLSECQGACTEDQQCQSFAFCPTFEGCYMKSKRFVGNEDTQQFYDCKTYYKRSCDGTMQ